MSASAAGANSMLNALRCIGKCEWTKQETCYVTLLKLLNNIVEHPAEEKFRHLKTTNATLRSKVFDIPGATDFLESIGFRHQEDQLVLPSDISTVSIRAAKDQLQHFADEANMDELRRQRDERIAAAKAEEAKHNKFEGHHAHLTHLTPEEEKEIQRQLALDRAEFEKDRQLYGGTHDGHAQELKYGAKEAEKSWVSKGGA
eukprot:TRINITY_DN5828_c1_g1_i1.p1 TRINITY_DN5828_c1_g1~~TRINITY_DN5828_c1_g1_i1.p1  ORF type:complete len:201 (+),score=53.94 TRINITY_DN5828_c1_g1_i1:94-696(+)